MMTKKRMIVGVVVTFALAALVGCGGASALAGKWVEEDGTETMELFKDGSGVITSGSRSVSVSWKVENKRFVITHAERAKAADYKLSGGKLIFTDDKGEISTYVKASKKAADISKTAGSDEGFDIQNGVLVEYTGTADKVTVPSNVTSIGSSAFVHCTSLTSVSIPKSVTSIGDRAFLDCTSLTSVSIPNSVTSIGELAFANCTSLTSVSIPKSVTSIGDGAFAACAGLVKITVASGNSAYTSIGGVLFNKAATTLVQVPPSRKGSYTVPKNVTSIGRSAFYACIGLVKITVDSGNSAYTSIDGVLFNADATKLIRYPAGKQDSIYTIPAGVTEIGLDAFFGCTGLTGVTIPNSVIEIGWAAFADCTSLRGVTIPNSVTEIGNRAFADCTSLTSVTLPADVALYADNISTSFDGNLRRVYYGNGKQAGTYVKDGDTWKKR